MSNIVTLCKNDCFQQPYDFDRLFINESPHVSLFITYEAQQTNMNENLRTYLEIYGWYFHSLLTLAVKCLSVISVFLKGIVKRFHTKCA